MMTCALTRAQLVAAEGKYDALLTAALKDDRETAVKLIHMPCQFCAVYRDDKAKGAQCRGCPLVSDDLCGLDGEGAHALVYFWATMKFTHLGDYPRNGAVRVLLRILKCIRTLRDEAAISETDPAKTGPVKSGSDDDVKRTS